MHVRTDWLGGEFGVSWFFHAKGSGIFLDCTKLPARGDIKVFKDRAEWQQKHGRGWEADGDKDVRGVSRARARGRREPCTAPRTTHPAPPAAPAG